MPPITPPIDPPPINDYIEPGESMLVVVRRHPIGLVFLYLEAFIGVAAVLGLFFFASPSSFRNLHGEAYRLFVAGVIFGIAVLIIFLLAATVVYRESKLIVTNKSLVQVLQKALFSRKISRLSMSNVEDVNAEQKGILATIFNYGTLVVQTAGEMENFIFPYCPDPNKFAHIILEARQAYAQALQEEAGGG